MEFLITRASFNFFSDISDKEFIELLKLPKWVEIVGVEISGMFNEQKCRIRINSLDELLMLYKDVGDLILQDNNLLIYDDYIE